jgi:hypothetical protein
MAIQTQDLWHLVLDHTYVDPVELAVALEEQAMAAEQLDYRTRLLIHESLEGLLKHWGRDRFSGWLSQSPVGPRLESIAREHFAEVGFPFLEKQIVEPTRPETIEQLLRELGSQLHGAVRLFIGGSGSLILKGFLTRRTQDLDVVDELPKEIRALGQFLDELKQRYRLQLAHFQSHYLPEGWQQRVHSLGPFGKLQVFLVDVYDIFLSKLFSGREKDRDDLRALSPQLDKEVLVRRLRETTRSLRTEKGSAEKAERNWYILFGESLPSET